jgi:hypothetical protein
MVAGGGPITDHRGRLRTPAVPSTMVGVNRGSAVKTCRQWPDPSGVARFGSLSTTRDGSNQRRGPQPRIRVRRPPAERVP